MARAAADGAHAAAWAMATMAGEPAAKRRRSRGRSSSAAAGGAGAGGVSAAVLSELAVAPGLAAAPGPAPSEEGAAVPVAGGPLASPLSASAAAAGGRESPAVGGGRGARRPSARGGPAVGVGRRALPFPMSSSGASEGGGPWVEGGEWAAATGSAAERVAQAPPVDVTQALHQARWLEALSEQALEAREDLVTLAQRLGEPGPRTGRAELMALAEVARESADAVGFALVGAGQTARRHWEAEVGGWVATREPCATSPAVLSLQQWAFDCRSRRGRVCPCDECSARRWARSGCPCPCWLPEVKLGGPALRARRAVVVGSAAAAASVSMEAAAVRSACAAVVAAVEPTGRALVGGPAQAAPAPRGAAPGDARRVERRRREAIAGPAPLRAWLACLPRGVLRVRTACLVYGFCPSAAYVAGALAAGGGSEQKALERLHGGCLGPGGA